MSAPDLTAPAIDPSMPAWEQALERNFKKVVFLFVLVLVGAIVWGVMAYRDHQQAEEAGGLLASAKTVEDCDIVVQRYPNTVAAGNAQLLKADLLWDQNKKDSSVAALREFISKEPRHVLIPHALLGLGSKLDSMGNKGEAKPLFERITNEFNQSDIAPLAAIRLADILWEEGKTEEARKAYESIPGRYAGAEQAFLNQSESRLALLNANLPTKEVDGPPKPKEAPAAPGAPLGGAPQIKLSSPGGSPMVPSLLNVTPSAPAPAAEPTAPATPAAPAAPAPAPAPSAPPAATPAAAPAMPAATPAPAPAAAPAAPSAPAPATPAPAPAKPAEAPATSAPAAPAPAAATTAPVPAPAPATPAAPAAAPATPVPAAPAPKAP